MPKEMVNDDQREECSIKLWYNALGNHSAFEHYNFQDITKIAFEISKNRFDHILKIPKLIDVVGTLIIFL